MVLAFKQETYRDDYTYRNSPEAVRRFPFPFDTDNYMYSVNIEPHIAGPKGSVFEHPIDIDEHYVSEMHDRALVLKTDPLRCQTLPHMDLAGWDLVELLMTSMSESYPEHFTLERNGNAWHWINRPLGIDDSFEFGVTSTLPYGPMEYITRQCQGDFCLLDQRDGNLWVDAGMVTTQADWSMDFDLGMNFFEWHAPVPLAHEKGVFERALKFLMQLRQGHPVRRFNWTMSATPRLDTSPENYHKWGHERALITAENVGERLHLRVELQALWRLPRSNAVVFSIRCYLASMNDIISVPKWGRRMHRVLRDIHPALAEYKGLTRYRETAIDFLSKYDDGKETSPGIWPD